MYGFAHGGVVAECPHLPAGAAPRAGQSPEQSRLAEGWTSSLPHSQRTAGTAASRTVHCMRSQGHAAPGDTGCFGDSLCASAAAANPVIAPRRPGLLCAPGVDAGRDVAQHAAPSKQLAKARHRPVPHAAQQRPAAVPGQCCAELSTSVCNDAWLFALLYLLALLQAAPQGQGGAASDRGVGIASVIAGPQNVVDVDARYWRELAKRGASLESEAQGGPRGRSRLASAWRLGSVAQVSPPALQGHPKGQPGTGGTLRECGEAGPTHQRGTLRPARRHTLTPRLRSSRSRRRRGARAGAAHGCRQEPRQGAQLGGWGWGWGGGWMGRAGRRRRRRPAGAAPIAASRCEQQVCQLKPMCHIMPSFGPWHRQLSRPCAPDEALAGSKRHQRVAVHGLIGDAVPNQVSAQTQGRPLARIVAVQNSLQGPGSSHDWPPWH